MAWLGTWGKRVKLTIDNTDIDAALSWFPVRVHLGTSVGRNSDDVSFVFDELESNDNRKKIAVTKTDGTTELYVEIEKWDDANEVANLWVSRDGWAIANDADTEFYLYYDSTHADNDTYVGDKGLAGRDGPRENVWDSNFKTVQHGNDETTSTITDSTSNNNDGTKKGANEPIVTTAGQIADAQDFDGANDFIVSTALAALQFGTGDFTISTWVKFDTIDDGTGQFVIALSYDTGVANDYHSAGLSESGGVIAARSRDAAGGSIVASNAIAAGTDYRITVVRISEVVYGYINGVAMSTTGVAGADFDYSSGGKVYIGGGDNDAGGVQYFTEGLIDEVRISASARNAAWDKASYESERDNLLDFGSQEIAGSATLSGAGTLAAIGRGIFIGKATLAGSGTLATIGRGIFIGKATLAGTGTLACIGHFIRFGKATLSGVGSLAAIGRGIFIGKAVLAGIGSLKVIGERICPVALSLKDRIFSFTLRSRNTALTLKPRTFSFTLKER